MAVRINGKDLKDAVMKTDQFELRITEFLPDHMNVNVKDISGHPFNFVPRFFEIVYQGEKTILAKDQGIIAVAAGKSIEHVVVFQEKLRIETFVMMDLRYARKKLGTISIE